MTAMGGRRCSINSAAYVRFRTKSWYLQIRPPGFGTAPTRTSISSTLKDGRCGKQKPPEGGLSYLTPRFVNQPGSATTADIVDPAINGLFSVGWFDLSCGWIPVCGGGFARILIGSRLLWDAGILRKGEGAACDP
jgi:hypothetical protein